MTTDAIVTTGLALAIAAVLALVLFSGRLSPVVRRRVEIALPVVAAVVFLPVYGWGLVSAVRDDDWLWVAMQPVLWIGMAVSIVRDRRRKAKAQARRPGTFG